MVIKIKTPRGLPIVIWFPLNALTLGFAIKRIDKESFSFSKDKVKNFIKAYRQCKRLYHHLVLVDVISESGAHIKVTM